MYTLEFSPLALGDMTEIVRYISKALGNPTAAENLAQDLVNAAESLTQFPYANPGYVPIRPLKQEYRKLSVQNYLLFYRVDEEAKTVIIARVLYGKRDLNRFIN